ncbi:helix-turn-helix transcriptional regulator [Proteiniclasticum sp.]|uniref:helix-turn-helix domain-containing protein n=1 Tax=Proteiniclasticum sp. TaxID=2053595 RepID=UPI00289D18DB|nr:helix-turn-helix transcriptional regulator [Proteiniclasticum sp.]
MRVDNVEEIAGVIKVLRKRRGLTQKKLSKLLGISNTYLCDIERSRTKPSIKILMKIVSVLDANLHITHSSIDEV